MFKADELITPKSIIGMWVKQFVEDQMEAVRVENHIDFTRITGIRSTFEARCTNLLTDGRTIRRKITVIKDPPDEITIYSHKLKNNT